MKVIGITGMPGSGKGIIATVARNLGFQVIRMGDIIRREARRRDAPIGETAIQIRKEYGDLVVAERCIEEIKKLETNQAQNGLYLIEGIRSPYEVELFKKNFKDFKVIAVNSTPQTRFKRLIKRKRADDSYKKSDFDRRDKRELKFGIGEVIATADYLIVNEGSINKLKRMVRGILRDEIRNEG